MTVIATGTVAGELTAKAVAGKAGTISGICHWIAPPFMSDKPAKCTGTYTAELWP